MVASASNQCHRVVPFVLYTGMSSPFVSVACDNAHALRSDIEPHNFVLDCTAHVWLIDFGSAVPLVPGSRLVPPEYCRVRCGTCDYISPEIQAHESALIAMEMSADEADEVEMNMGKGGGYD